MNSEFMPIDIANGFISVIQKKDMPNKLKLWTIDNIKNFNTLCYEKRKFLYDNILSKIVDEEDDEEEDTSTVDNVPTSCNYSANCVWCDKCKCCRWCDNCDCEENKIGYECCIDDE